MCLQGEGAGIRLSLRRRFPEGAAETTRCYENAEAWRQKVGQVVKIMMAEPFLPAVDEQTRPSRVGRGLGDELGGSSKSNWRQAYDKCKSARQVGAIA